MAEDHGGRVPVPGDAQVATCPPDIGEKEPTGIPLLHAYKYPLPLARPPGAGGTSVHVGGELDLLDNDCPLKLAA